MCKTMNPDVPVEIAALWAFKENKKLREKLETLTTYAKYLEQERDELKRELTKQREKNCALAKTAERNAGVLPVKLKTMRKAIGHLKQGINMLESGKYAEEVEAADQEIIEAL